MEIGLVQWEEQTKFKLPDGTWVELSTEERELVEELVKEIDVNADGNVDLDEMVRFLMAFSSLPDEHLPEQVRGLSQEEKKIGARKEAQRGMKDEYELERPFLSMDEFRIQAIGFASRDPVATKKVIETLRSQPQEHTHEMIRRMDSTAPHRAAMDKYLQASLDTQPEVIKSLEGYFRTTFQEMTQRVHVDKEDPKMVFQDMMQKAMADQENTKKQATVVASDLLSGELSGLWNEYDQDSNGDLSPEELEALLKDCVQLWKKNLSVVTDQSLKNSVDMVVSLMGSIARQLKNACPDNENIVKMAEATGDQMAEQTQTALDQMRPIIMQASTQVMDEMLSDLSGSAKAMIEEMDKNHDGKVSKAEFEAHFVGALDKILSPDQKMVEIMIAEREAQYSYAPLLG